MASIADHLGIQWDAPAVKQQYRLTAHAAKEATKKGFSHEAILQAANDPQTRTENHRYPGQMRHVRGDVVAVVDPTKGHVITSYLNVKETAVRPDQTDDDAKAFALKQAQRRNK